MNEQVSENLKSLESAFHSFDALSRDLSLSYQNLGSTVVGLANQVIENRQKSEAEQQNHVEQNQRFRALMDALPVAVIVIDQFGCIRYSNQAVKGFFGEPLIGRVWRDFISSGGIRMSEDGEIILADGRKVVVSTKPLGYEPGQIIALYDITSPSNLKSMSHRFDLSSLVKRINSTLAHQIRTPLTSTLLYAGQLKNIIHDEKSRSYIDKIINNINHLECVTQNLLSNIDCPNKQFDDVSVEEILNEVCEVVTPLARKSKIELIIENKHHDISIKCNKDMFKSIFLNIIINAMQSCIEKRFENIIHLCDEGESAGAYHVVISLNIVESGTVGNVLVIAVQDNGIGIKGNNHEVIFDPYYTTKENGNGLGLSVANAVIKSMGGTISADPKMSEGAKIILNLPLCHSGQDK